MAASVPWEERRAYLRGGRQRGVVSPGVGATRVLGSYLYGDYVNNITTEWQQVTQTISTAISGDITACPVIMVSKNPGGSVIIDDVTITFSDTAN